MIDIMTIDVSYLMKLIQSNLLYLPLTQLDYL